MYHGRESDEKGKASQLYPIIPESARLHFVQCCLKIYKQSRRAWTASQPKIPFSHPQLNHASRDKYPDGAVIKPGAEG